MAGEKEKTKTTKAAEEQQQQRWGASEELLLACAVNRHGTKDWDSIAMEVQNRTATLTSLTPKSCEDKFHGLIRRFGFPSQNDAESAGLLVVSDLVDQLRQIRVRELRAEVRRHDVSIVSLEMKVKRLEEERERSEKADADLERETKALPKVVPGKSSAVEADSDERENRSFNESNSMTQKPETTTNKEQNDAVLDVGEREPTKVKPEPEAEAGPVLGEPDRDRGWSSNGKLNGTGNVKDDDENDKTTSDWEIKKNNKTNGADGLSESNELWDESKGEGKEAGLRVAVAAAPKQSSDLQSSASLSKTMRRGGAAGCSSSEEVSPATRKVLAVKSEPLIGLLAMIRSHRLGSHFERRLRSQESERYKKLVRQHIDLRTIQSRLDKGLYSNCFQKFYRDLLLLFNNFIIFFKKTSQEHAAARELRALVIKEMVDKLRKPKPERELKLPRRVSLSKPSRGSTMVPCGRRSNSVKALSENANSRKEKEKPKVNEKKVGGSLLGVEEKGVKKRRINERSSVSGRKNSTSGNNNKSNKKGGGGGGGGEVKHQYGNNELSSHDGLDAKLDKKEISMKKRGAASFLRRMKQNSPKKVAEEESDEEEEDEDDDDDKDSEDESKDSRVELEEMKKGRSNNNNSKKYNDNNKNKRDVRRERVTRSSSNSKGKGGGGEREESGKKVLGRPPKRSIVVGGGERKRGRENGESEVGGLAGGGGKSARKRTRR